MITQQQLTAVLGELPEQFSIGELVDKLVNLPIVYAASQRAASRAAHFSAESDKEPDGMPPMPVASPAPPPVLAGNAERAYYSSPEAQKVYAKFPSSPEVRALKGMAAGLSEADKQKTAKEWEAERIREKYGV